MSIRNTSSYESYASSHSSGETTHSGGPLNGVHKRHARKKQSNLQHMAQQPPLPQIRWLIESAHCARVLGSGGSRLRTIRDLCREPGANARISQQVAGAEFRLFTATGSPLSTAKMGGLMVRCIFNEPDLERSDERSRPYDLKLLVPWQCVGAIDQKSIEEKSHAQLNLEQAPLPNSDEVVLHIFGVADAVQIALFHCAEILKNAKPERPYNPLNNSPDVSQGELKLPHIEEDPDLPNTVFVAYEIARSSKSAKLRQIIHLDQRDDFDTLVRKIEYVTDCRVELHNNLTVADDNKVSLLLHGAPEENMLALFLLYRFLRRKNTERQSNHTA